MINMTNIVKDPTDALKKDFWEINAPKFFIGLAIALGIRLLLISLPIAFWVDMNLYKSWAIDLVQMGISNFYDYSKNCDYPPAYLYPLWAIGKIYQSVNPSFTDAFSHTEGLFLMEMIKIPPVLADIAAAILITKILKPHVTADKAYKLGLLYAFNPLMIFVSGIWGQVDGIMSFLMLVAFYLIQKNSVIRTGLLISLMLIIKPQGLFFAPFLVLSQWFRQAWWKWGAIALSGLGLIWLVILPFFAIGSPDLIGIAQPFIRLYTLLKSTANYYNFASVNAFNFWGWANWIRDYTTFLGVSYKVIGLALLAILMGWLGIFLYQQNQQAQTDKDRQQDDYQKMQFTVHSLAVAVMLFGCFMLPTRMHERYMLYSLPFWAIAIAQIPTMKWIYWGLTITGAANVGYAYVRYNYEDRFYATPEVWLQSIVYVSSIINMILFGLALFHTFRLFQLFRLQASPALES